jgi:phosphatidylserine/phosphatidylglycerophosphate/cardiolipin synthase-like enzyme
MVLVGSMNMDPRSVNLNSEIGLAEELAHRGAARAAFRRRHRA